MEFFFRVRRCIDFFHTKGVGAFHGKLEANELDHMILLWFRMGFLLFS